MENKETRRKEGLRARAATWLDVPADALAGLPLLELMGDRELRLEQYRGILLCDKTQIHVDGGAWVLCIAGQDLEIRVMRERELLIVGRIVRLELL